MRRRSEDFTVTENDLVRQLGLPAAYAYGRITWRASARHRGGSWVITYIELAEDLGLSVKVTRSAVTALIEAGLMVTENAGTGARTLRFTPVPKPPEGVSKMPSGGFVTSIGEDVEDNYSPDDSVAAGQEASMEASEQAEVIPFDGGLFPAEPIHTEPTPEQMAHQCRTAWIAAYTERHGPPDPTIKRRGLGQIRVAGKDRETADDWRALWRACHAAGLDGRYAISDYLGPAPVSRYPRARNYDLEALMAQNAAAGPPQLDSTTELAMRMLGGSA